MELNSNIKKLRQLSSISQKEFADILGVRNTVLSNWEQGLSKPDIQIILKISDYFGIPVSELVNTKITNDYSFNSSDKNKIVDTPITTNNNKGIPLIPISAMAGFANGDTQIMDYEIIENYVIPEFIEKGVKYLIRVGGSSMYPKYSNGDLLACRPVHDLTFFQWGKVYVLDTDQGPLVKRLFPNKDNEDYIECRSDNHTNYPPFKISKVSIRKVSIVLGVIRME